MQRALIQYRNPANYDLVYEALMKEGRQDLIGFDKNCLIRPRRAFTGKGTGSFKSGKEVKSGKGTGGFKSGKDAKSGKGTGAKKKTIRNVHKKKR